LIEKYEKYRETRPKEEEVKKGDETIG